VRVHQTQLDFLRGLAATYVLINHARGAFFIGGEKLLASSHSPLDYLSVAMLQLTSLGAEAVILFFVLSGFAMAHSIEHSGSAGQFYLRRIIRIWPPYVAATLFAALIAGVVGKPFNALAVAFYQNASTPVTPQFWSLPYEVAFYVLCPLILRGRIAWLAAVSAAAAVATVIGAGPMLNPWSSFSLNFLGNELPLFLIGAAAYRHFDRIPLVTRWPFAGLAGAAFVAVAGLKLLLAGSNLLGNLIVAGMTVLAIRNLPDRAAFNFGRFSYSIYLYSYALIALAAWLVRPVIDASTIRDPFLWSLVVPPVLAICFLLYWLTERPCCVLLAKLRTGEVRAGRSPRVRT
jgi:peptidoglycan/LPS O-acetylase OafA/YrhL